MKDSVPVLRLRRRGVRQETFHVTWLHIGNNIPLPNGEQILGDVVHQLLT